MSFRKSITIRTSGSRQVQIVTDAVGEVISASRIAEGLCVAFVPHTSAAITINENADPDVQTDLLAAFEAMVPQVGFRHGEGNSDAHLLASLIGCSATVPVAEGRLVLGRWQGLWFVELDGPRERQLEIHVIAG